ncbi:MAG TPA: protein tyrosine phosphatase family protein [Isosphaeraceae bacterium]
MNFQREITPAIVIADQPTEADLASLKAAGFVGVVNVRDDGEPEQPLSTAAEGEKARALGLDYIHMGIGSAPLLEMDVDAVCRFIDEHTKKGKVLVHCRKGGRAIALVLLQQARAHGWSAAEALDKGRAMGLQVDGQLKTMVENYLRERS